ncbi:MAG: RnfH family protein [Pseudomonadota bacterium]|jgi:putative ubiquitin-RnfH superfamily antitoxin RatB of RatAB toxin-antitoxin module
MPTPVQATRYVVEVVALAGKVQFSKTLLVPHGQTLGWAMNASGLFALHPHLRTAEIGVWGKILPPETLVAKGDRIEVYQAIQPTALVAHRSKLQALRVNKNHGKVPA